MRFKKIFLLICLLICLFAMASVCASDANDTAMSSEDKLEIYPTTDDITGVDKDEELAFPYDNNHTYGAVRSSDYNSNPILNQSDSASEVLGDGYNPNVHIDIGDDPGSGHFTIIINIGKTLYVEGDTFADIQKTIYSSSEGDTIVLTGGKTYWGDGNFIRIDKHLTLTSQGGNAILDGQNLSSILKVYQGCKVTVENIDFINGMSSGSGGALAWGGPNGCLKNCNFINNNAIVYAGAFYWVQNDAIIENCNFINNSAGSSGAVLIGGYRNKFINCNFTGNHASNHAGALHVGYDDNEVINCNFVNNSAFDVGAVRTQGNNDKFVGCNFVQNSASFVGALCWWPYNEDADSIWGNHTLSNCTFVDNSATSGYGGAIYCTANDIKILHSNFTNNSARDQEYGIGGAIIIQAMNGVIRDCIFKDNFASRYGGAISMSPVSIVDENGNNIKVYNNLIIDSIFIDNFANAGKAIFSNEYSKYSAQILGCTFKFKASGAALNSNDENLSLTFDLLSLLNYKKTIAVWNYLGVLFLWNGESFDTININSVPFIVDDFFPTYYTIGGVNQSIILEIYNSTNGLVANITDLTDSSGQITYDYRSLPDGQYTYKAYHPDNSECPFVLNEGSFERIHIPTSVSISVSNVTYPETAVATVTASSPGTYKLVIAGIDYDNITFTDSEISIGGGEASKTVNVNLLGANNNYEALVTYEISDRYSYASNQTRFTVYKLTTQVNVDETIGYYGKDTEIRYSVANVYFANITSIKNNAFELVEGRDYSIISNENGKLVIRGLAIGTYVVNLTAGLDDNHYPSSKEFSIIINPLVDVSIDVSASNQTPFYGDTIAYTITLTNYGPNDATGVIVTSVIPEGMNVSSQDASYMGNGIWNISLIGAGSENAVTLTLYATLNKPGAIASSFNVASNEHDDNTKNNNAGITVDVEPVSNLNVAIHADINPNILIGDLIAYTITVANDGPCDAKNVNVNGYLSGLLQFVSAKASTGNYNSSTGVWNVNELKVGEFTNLTLTFKVISDGTIKNTFGVESDEYDSNTSDNAVESIPLIIDPLVDLSIDVSASSQTPFYGDIIAYTITVANSGPSVATGVIVTSVIPEGMNVSSRDASYMGNGIWNISLIGAGSENAVTLTLNATPNIPGAIASSFNVASNEHDDNTKNNNVSITVDVEPVSNLNVVVISNADSSVGIDDLITYTITVTNKGPCDVTGAKVTGQLSNLLQFVSAKASIGNYDGASEVWNIGNLGVGDFANLTLTFRVISDGTIKNAFDVESDVYDFDTSDNSVDSIALFTMKISTAFDCKNMLTTAIDISVDGKIGQYYSLVLRDAKNNLLADKTVQISLNNVIYTVKTDSNGVARLQVNIKKSGTYTAGIKFKGDGKYMGSSASVVIKVNKQKPKIISSKKKFSRGQKNKKITATLKTSRGKALKGKRVVFVIKGKKYKTKTNSKGIATVKVKLTKRGKYTCSIKYAGDETYSSIVKKIGVVIK